MSKLLPTLFLIVIIAFIGAIAYISFTDIDVETKTIEKTVTYEQFKSEQSL